MCQSVSNNLNLISLIMRTNADEFSNGPMNIVRANSGLNPIETKSCIRIRWHDTRVNPSDGCRATLLSSVDVRLISDNKLLT